MQRDSRGATNQNRAEIMARTMTVKQIRENGGSVADARYPGREAGESYVATYAVIDLDETYDGQHVARDRTNCTRVIVRVPEVQS